MLLAPIPGCTRCSVSLSLGWCWSDLLKLSPVPQMSRPMLLRLAAASKAPRGNLSTHWTSPSRWGILELPCSRTCRWLARCWFRAGVVVVIGVGGAQYQSSAKAHHQRARYMQHQASCIKHTRMASSGPMPNCKHSYCMMALQGTEKGVMVVGKEKVGKSRLQRRTSIGRANALNAVYHQTKHQLAYLDSACRLGPLEGSLHLPTLTLPCAFIPQPTMISHRILVTPVGYIFTKNPYSSIKAPQHPWTRGGIRQHQPKTVALGEMVRDQGPQVRTVCVTHGNAARGSIPATNDKKDVGCTGR